MWHQVELMVCFGSNKGQVVKGSRLVPNEKNVGLHPRVLPPTASHMVSQMRKWDAYLNDII
jgi:hypothetical protein